MLHGGPFHGEGDLNFAADHGHLRRKSPPVARQCLYRAHFQYNPPDGEEDAQLAAALTGVMFQDKIVLNFFRKATNSPMTDRNDRIYAIGDVHGRHDLLLKLLNEIGLHQDRLEPSKSTYMLLLGDIVDRGPESSQVIRHLRKLSHRSPNLITLMGNHEDMMVRALRGDPGFMRGWMRMGGKATLHSYGVTTDDGPEDFELLARAREAIPKDDIEWLASLPLSIRSGDYFFCHAGIKPGVGLKRQSRSDLLWIRQEFLDYAGPHGVTVVHGHSISEQVQVHSNRIGIDTGAYRSGKLTALYVEEDKREFLSVCGGETDLPDIDPEPAPALSPRTIS